MTTTWKQEKITENSLTVKFPGRTFYNVLTAEADLAKYFEDHPTAELPAWLYIIGNTMKLGSREGYLISVNASTFRQALAENYKIMKPV